MKVCRPIQYSDQTVCKTCGLTWDTNDSDEPPCPFDPVDPIKPYPTVGQVAGCIQMIMSVVLAVAGIMLDQPNALFTATILGATAPLHFK